MEHEVVEDQLRAPVEQVDELRGSLRPIERVVLGDFDHRQVATFDVESVSLASELLFLLEQYSAEDAERWGLVNKVVPGDQLLDAAKEYGNTIAQYSPTALRFLKHSFNADTDHQGGLSQMAIAGMDVFAVTDEAKEGAAAFAEKRKPDFARYQVEH